MQTLPDALGDNKRGELDWASAEHALGEAAKWLARAMDVLGIANASFAEREKALL